MKRLATFMLCVWALLEPPYKDNVTPVLKAPYKEWTIAHYTRGDMSVPYYFDTRMDCEKRRNELAMGAEKVCLPVNPINVTPRTYSR